jgi:addiction module HigA family antidote
MSEPIAKVGMTPCHPGEFIREEILNELDLPVARAAAILGVRRATLSDLVNAKAALSPEMALRIEKAFGVSMDTLLRMQAWHDSHAMRQRFDQNYPKPPRCSTRSQHGPRVSR